MARKRVFTCDICGNEVDAKDVNILSCFGSDGTILPIDDNTVAIGNNRLRFDVCTHCYHMHVRPVVLGLFMCETKTEE